MPAAIVSVMAINDVNILEINRPYPIIWASRIVQGTLSTFLLTILRDVNHIVKMYMPEICDTDVEDNFILSINTRSEKYTLTYKGRCKEELVHKFHLEPAS